MQRDEKGLLKGVDYKHNEDGSINWRAMINEEHLYVNPDRFKGKEVPLSIEGLDDSKLLIKLGGIKELARLRGFRKVSYEIVQSTLDHCTAICKITWIPNFETNGEEVEFASTGEAHLNNVDGFSKNFLVAIAENRAFVRAVRNFLNIHIVGADEITKGAPVNNVVEQQPLNSTEPVDILIKKLRLMGCKDFAEFKISVGARNIVLNERLTEAVKNANTITELNKKQILGILGELPRQ